MYEKPRDYTTVLTISSSVFNTINADFKHVKMIEYRVN